MPDSLGFFSQRFDDVRHILGRLRKGHVASPQETDDLTWFSETVGLNRPIQEYSPRSQRRIFQRLNEGATTSKDIYRKEYVARKEATDESLEEHGLKPAQWKTIDRLRNQVVQYGVDADPYMDDEFLQEVALLYGYDYLHNVLTDQVDSIQKYLEGNPDPGNARWNARGSLEAHFGASAHVNFIRGTDPYYYYHGRRI